MKEYIQNIVETFDFNQVNTGIFDANSLGNAIIDQIHDKIVHKSCPVLTSNEYLMWVTNTRSKNPRQYVVKNDEELENIVNKVYTEVLVDTSTSNDKRFKEKRTWYLPMNFNWLDTHNVTNLDFIFADMDDQSRRAGYVLPCEKNDVHSINVSKWNTSNVQSMRSIFMSCQCCADTDISMWDVHNCKYFERLFIYSNFSKENMDKIKRKWKITPPARVVDMYDCR